MIFPGLTKAAVAAMLLVGCSDGAGSQAVDPIEAAYLEAALDQPSSDPQHFWLMEVLWFDPDAPSGEKVYIHTVPDDTFAAIFGNLYIDPRQYERGRYALDRTFPTPMIRGYLPVHDSGTLARRLAEFTTMPRYKGSKNLRITVILAGSDDIDLAAAALANLRRLEGTADGCRIATKAPDTEELGHIAMLLETVDRTVDLADRDTHLCFASALREAAGLVIEDETLLALTGYVGGSGPCEFARVGPYPAPNGTTRVDLSGCPVAPEYRRLAASYFTRSLDPALPDGAAGLEAACRAVHQDTALEADCAFEGH